MSWPLSPSTCSRSASATCCRLPTGKFCSRTHFRSNVDLSRLHGSLTTTTRTHALSSRPESHEASSSFDSTHSVGYSLDALPIPRPNSRVAESSADEIDTDEVLDRRSARTFHISEPLALLGSPAAPSSMDPPPTSIACERTAAHPFDAKLTSLSCQLTALLIRLLST